MTAFEYLIMPCNPEEAPQNIERSIVGRHITEPHKVSLEECIPDMEDSIPVVNTHLVGGHMDLQLLGFPAVRTSSMRGILQWQYGCSTVCCSPEFPPSFLL